MSSGGRYLILALCLLYAGGAIWSVHRGNALVLELNAPSEAVRDALQRLERGEAPEPGRVADALTALREANGRNLQSVSRLLRTLMIVAASGYLVIAAIVAFDRRQVT